MSDRVVSDRVVPDRVVSDRVVSDRVVPDRVMLDGEVPDSVASDSDAPSPCHLPRVPSMSPQVLLSLACWMAPCLFLLINSWS